MCPRGDRSLCVAGAGLVLVTRSAPRRLASYSKRTSSGGLVADVNQELANEGGGRHNEPVKLIKRTLKCMYMIIHSPIHHIANLGDCRSRLMP